jgi:signal transduction histidine kinase
MRPEVVTKVFDRFYRADPARTRDHGGTGLGLAIVKSLTEAHGGRVTCASTVEDGTTFVVTLPLAPGAP